MKKFQDFIKENKESEEEIPTFSFSDLSDKAKENAKWEVQQRNKVAKHQNITGRGLTINNSLFYSNGVYSGKNDSIAVGNFVNIGDRIMVPKGLTTDPANRQGQYGDVVHITKSGDSVVEFSDGGIGVYAEGTLEK